MKITNSHKALAITLLISASLLLLVFNFHVIKQNEALAEILIDITPLDLFEDNTQEEILDKENTKKTNKGFNDTKDYKHFAQAYTAIAPPKDYVNPKLNKLKEQTLESKKPSQNEGQFAIDNSTLTSFKSVNSVLKNSLIASQQASAKPSINKNSTISYSLLKRTATFLPIPVYLCEAHGKIVVNITVNNNGTVLTTSINTSSNSNNECLQNHALEYAKKTRFDSSKKESQIGTITFNFEGKT